METHALTVMSGSLDVRSVHPSTAVSRSTRAPMRLALGKILIVDDNDIDQLRAAVLSNELGAVVEVVGSGRHALAALEASRDVQLVLMDCEMPGMSGLEATREWRRIERGWRSAIPIIGISRRGTADYVSCLAAGMNDCLAKPLVRADVQRCFARWTAAEAPVAARKIRTVMYAD